MTTADDAPAAPTPAPARSDETTVRVRAVALTGVCGEEVVGVVEHGGGLEPGTRVALRAPGWTASRHAAAAAGDGVAAPGPTGPTPSVAAPGADGGPGDGAPAGAGDPAGTGTPTVTVPRAALTTITAVLPWHLLAAVVGPVRTAHACLGALALGPGESVFVREADSPLGATLCVLARRRGLRVVAATRDVRQVAVLTALGLDDVLLDDAHLAPRVREIVPDGVEAALEAAPVPTDADTQAALAPGGRLLVSEEVPGLDTTALPDRVLQAFLDDVPAGRAPVVVDSVLPLTEAGQALRRLAGGRARGAVVLVARGSDLPEPGRLGTVPDPLALRG